MSLVLDLISVLGSNLKSDLERIIELRQEVLHPGGPRERVVYAQDQDETTIHLIYKNEGGDVLAVGALILESEEGSTDGFDKKNELRIRGMAVKENLRGRGMGSKLLDEFISIAKDKACKKIWCNARERVLPLYERKGFVKFGDVFDVPGSGPHYRMKLIL